MAARSAADGVLLVDKPAGITSTRALATARRALAADKAGHTGTLDPFATGLLPLVFGEATKFSRFLIDSTKSYQAVLYLGAETDSGDPETAPRPGLGPVPDRYRIDGVISTFAGDQRQVPPMHSAVHVQGRRLYEYAREGREVEREARHVRISDLRVLRFDPPELELAVTCSKGTYIRVLAQDIGRALGCGAYLTALRRTAVGPLSLDQAASLDAITGQGPAARARLLPPEVLVEGLPRVRLEADAAWRFAHGQPVEAEAVACEAVAVFTPEGRFLGVARAFADGRIEPLRLLASAAEIP